MPLLRRLRDASRSHEAFWAAPLLLATLFCCAFAFVGLDASSYWIDELFTLFVVDHHGGLAEVYRRALTDTHPPLYYFILNAWIGWWGDSEIATRSLSAIFAVSALGVLLVAMPRGFSLTARAFTLAMGAGSRLFFDEAQNARSYSLCLLLGAGLLALTLSMDERLKRGQRLGTPAIAALGALSMAGAFTHFYLLPATGGLHLYLLLRARRPADRAGVILSGLVVAGMTAAYCVVLLQNSQQDIHHMWFSNRAGALAYQLGAAIMSIWAGAGMLAMLAMLLAPWFRRMAERATGDADVPVLCLTVIVFTILAGLVVSFTLAPSFGRRNLLVLGPFFWVLSGWMFDALRLDTRRWGDAIFQALLVGLCAANALMLSSRLLPRNEEWRASAHYVAAQPGCRDLPIPVVLPFVFGPDKPFFHDLARNYFFGRYFVDWRRLAVRHPDAFAPGADPALGRLLHDRAHSGSCRVLAWGVHDLKTPSVELLRASIARTAGVPVSQITVRVFEHRRLRWLGSTRRKPSAWVFEASTTPHGRR